MGKILTSDKPASVVMVKPHLSLFAEQEREDRRTKLGDPLLWLAGHVDFEALTARIERSPARPSGPD